MRKEDLIEKLKEEKALYRCEISKLRAQVSAKECEIESIRKSLAFRLAEKLAAVNQKLGNGIVLRTMRKIKRICTSTNGNTDTVAECIVKSEYDGLLSLYELEFYHFKEKREEKYHINLGEVISPYVKDLVSIILPVYNGGDLLVKSIESVLNQTYSYFEFIIVDDGSTDETPRIIDEYALRDSRIRVIHKENEKLPKTLSRGFKEARGEFFTWTSADNIMNERCIETMVKELNDFPNTGMVFANMRLIDERDKPIVTNGWYANRFFHENVMLPSCMLELNTYANNYIGAAFMYRADVAHVLEDYSVIKYCTEDYDYWMRINSLFQLRHICSQEPIYNYRMHSQSLTSRDKELKITENRYRLMLLDAFRREYYLKPMVWVIEGEEDALSNEIKEKLGNLGHLVIGKQNAKLYCDSLYERVVYLQIGNQETVNEKSEYGYRIYMGDACDDVISDEWNCLISRNKVTAEDFLEGHKGWFYFESVNTMLCFLDAKIKNFFLYAIEQVIELKQEYSKKISIITVCGDNVGDLKNILFSLEKQKTGWALYEVLVACRIDDYIWAKEALDILRKQGLLLPVRLVVSSTDNIVDCYNSAIWASDGEIISVFESSCYCEDDYTEKLMYYFGLYDNVSGLTVETRENGRIGNIIMKADALKLTGGFMRSMKQNETASWTGWEESPLLKLKNNNMEFMECEQIVIHMPDNRTMGGADRIESLLNRYSLEVHQLKPYDTWPATFKQKIESLSSSLITDKEHRKILREIDDLEVVLNKVEDDFTVRRNRDFIRQMYSLHLYEKENKLAKLAEIGMLSESVLLVSVIVPIYKVEAYLERCVDSILKQTVANIEVILVDDGSPDECPRLCDSYAIKDKRVKVIHKENGGLSDARNAGLDIAQGKYISFIDSDDWIELNMLEELCYAAEVFQAEIAECDFCNVYRDKIVNEMNGTGLYYTATNLEALKWQLDWSYFKCIACNKIYRSTLFNDGKRYPKGKHHEDEFFTYRVTYEANKLVYVDIPLYFYDHRREDSITGRKFNIRGLDAVEAWREKVKFYNNKNLPELYIQTLDLYVWVALDRLDLCQENHINGKRVEEVKQWLKEDYKQMLEAGLNEEKIKAVEKYIR